MKARIVPPPPAALAWGFAAGGGEEAALRRVCEKAGLRLRRVEPAQLGCTVACLCGLAGPQRAKGPAAGEWPAALVLQGLEGRALDDFLEDLAAAGLSIPLKAVVTAANRGWAFGALLDELLAERRALRRGKA